MDSGLPLVAVLGLLTFVLVRAREADWITVTVAWLFGMYLALTPATRALGEWLTGWLDWLVSRF